MRCIKRAVCIPGIMFFIAGLSIVSIEASQNGNPQTNCPVMGGAISKDTFSDYGGKRIY